MRGITNVFYSESKLKIMEEKELLKDPFRCFSFRAYKNKI